MNIQSLTNAQILSTAPSIFSGSPKAGLSEKYSFIPTFDVVDAMSKEGFMPMQAVQTRSRKEGNAFYAKHMVRFRHQGSIGTSEFPEIVLINSHDGTSAFKLLAGYFRMVCGNGLIVGSMLNQITVRHAGSIADDVIEGSYKVLSDIRENEGKISSYKGTMLSWDDQSRFANAAMQLRWGDSSPISAQSLLTMRRIEDNSDDLWTVFNRIQENVLRGGLTGWTSNNRRMTTRGVRSIDENIRLNRQLWDLADTYAVN